MSIRFAINGVGRIGRALIRITSQRPRLQLVAVNDLADARSLAALLARDSLHGTFPGQIAAEEGGLIINGHPVAAFQEPEPERIPWSEKEPAIVVDATGLAKSREVAQSHRRGSVRKVLVSANADGMDLTLCVGINQNQYDPARHHLLSASSCTTNCLAPLIFVLQREFHFERGIFNTVHSYNNDQRLLSHPHSDPRRAREAALNMIPTTTSASHAIHQILPELQGKIDGFAIRVPTPNVSLIDLVALLGTKPTVAAVNEAFAGAAANELQGVLAVTDAELVSSDFLGDPHSAIVDLPLTQIVDQHLFRVVAWYDNEWGHASRLADLLELLGESLL